MIEDIKEIKKLTAGYLADELGISAEKLVKLLDELLQGLIDLED